MHGAALEIQVEVSKAQTYYFLKLLYKYKLAVLVSSIESENYTKQKVP